MLMSVRRIFYKNLVKSTKIQATAYRNLTTQNISPSTLSLQKDDFFYPRRFKKKQAKSEEKSETELESNDDDFLDDIQDKNTKTLKISVTSLRVDAILKSSLGIARNKIETLFYESKLRINGQKILKKSASIQEGGEIDVIKGPDVKNPKFTVVSRVEIISITPKQEGISIKIRRCKSLSVEDYAKER